MRIEEFDIEVVPMANALPQDRPAKTPTPNQTAKSRIEPHPDVVAALARLVLGARKTPA